MFPGSPQPEIRASATFDRDGYVAYHLSMAEHTGTHVDAPAHFIHGGWTVDRIPPERLTGPGVVIRTGGGPRDVATVEDVLAWERRHGRIPDGAIVFFHTGWGARWDYPERYINGGEFPGLLAELARWLVEHRRIAGVGIDTLSVDPGRSVDFEVHKILHGAGIYHIENAANLDRLPPAGARVVVAPIPIRGGSGAPARVFAVVR